MKEPEKQKRGFALMDKDKLREIASKSGKSVPYEKRTFVRDPELAAAAGRKGGAALAPEKRAFSMNHELAVAAGRKGGLASGAKKKATVAP